ncbi:MAG: polymer-forming cytoskeletal protein [Myxococcales bacterium]|nr:polymer-forming cytoskeletal protein [Myxococcales bacterium]
MGTSKTDDASEDTTTSRVAVTSTPAGVGPDSPTPGPQSRAQDAEASEGPRACTTLGSTIVVRGQLTCGEDLVVQGRVEAELTSSCDVRVESGGVVIADVTARSIRVSGVVIGDLCATEVVELTRTARVVGNIEAPRLVVADGAQLDGLVETEGLEDLQRLLPDANQATRLRTALRPTGAPSSRVSRKPKSKRLGHTIVPLDEQPVPKLKATKPIRPRTSAKVAEDEPTAPQLAAPTIGRPAKAAARFEPKDKPSEPTVQDEETQLAPTKKRGWFSFGS